MSHAMIATTSSGPRFAALARYLLHGRSGVEPERVAWTASRNLGTDNPELAAALMQATANQNVRVERPVYHLTINFAPDDPVTPEQMRAAADRVLVDLGLAEHQALLVAHQDRAHPHVHVMVNRVHPETGRAWERWQDRPQIEHALRELERELGLRQVAGRLYQLKGLELPERALLTNGERREVARTGEPAFPDRVRAYLPELRAARSWAELEQTLDDHGLRLERKGQGLVMTDGERQVKASRVARDLSLARLEQKFGVPCPGREKERALQEPISADVAQLREALPEYERITTLEHDRQRATDDLAALRQQLYDLNSALEALPPAEKDFDRLLATVYRNPVTAHASFRAAAASVGAERAVEWLKSEPDRFGELITVERRTRTRLFIVDDPAQARAKARTGAHYGRTLIEAKRRAASLAAQHGQGGRETAVRLAAERARTKTDERISEMQARIDRLMRELRQAPSLRLLRESISRVIERLEPSEIAQLRLLVTAPQAALAFQAREAFRDIALGREMELER